MTMLNRSFDHCFGNWITFGGVAMAIGIMRLGEETDDPPE